MSDGAGPLTPSQTVGPFLAIALRWPDGPDVVEPGSPARCGCADACSTATASR